MNIVPVVSNSISAIGYDDTTLKMLIAFKNNSAYMYNGISPEIYHAFLNAPSKGKFYNQYIKGKYIPIKIPNP